jgi:hypothetical protein
MTEKPDDATRSGEEQKEVPAGGGRDAGRPHVRTEGEMAVDDALGQGDPPRG